MTTTSAARHRRQVEAYETAIASAEATLRCLHALAVALNDDLVDLEWPTKWNDLHNLKWGLERGLRQLLMARLTRDIPEATLDLVRNNID